MKGRFKPKNPQKYKGNPNNIIYRSSWELSFMNYLDKSGEVISWGSEETVVPYLSPIDSRRHRYFVDFIVTKLNKRGNKETVLIEIKPANQTKPPIRKSRVTKRYLTEARNYVINMAKWRAADHYAKSRGWKFHIYTEKELGLW
jgi:TnsA endonuclease N terminal